MIDYAAMAKKAGQSLEKDTLSFQQGQTVIALVPFERGFPAGMPSITVEVFGSGEEGLSSSKYFKRTVATTEQAYALESEHFQDAMRSEGKELSGKCPLKEWAADNLGSKGTKTSSVTYWVVVPLAFRVNKKNDFQPDYTKPKIMTAKRGKNDNPHIQAQIDEMMNDGGVELIQKLLGDPGAVQCLVVERKGTGQFGTSFDVSLAEGEYAEFALSEEIQKDIEEATKPGGACDLNQFIAAKFIPDAEEIGKRLRGEGGSSDPGMGED